MSKLDSSGNWEEAKPATVEGTEQIMLRQTMLRIADPARSLASYCGALGITLEGHA